jgi:two-component system, NarL family, response regulator LiaR
MPYEVWVSSPHGVLSQALAHTLRHIGCKVSGAARPRLGTDVALIDLCHTSTWPPPPAGIPTLGLVCAGSEDLPALLLLGYHGYVTSSDPVEVIVKAFEAVRRGEVWAERRVLSKALDLARRGRPLAKQGNLTDREFQVRRLVEGGLSNDQIALRLGISEKTVKVHLTHVYRKLGVRNRVSLALLGHEPAP